MAYRLMIGEKSPVIRSWLEMTFPPEEFILHFFSDGYDLQEAIKKSPPDLTLCRLSLPGKDGYQLAEWFREEDLAPKTALIVYKGPFDEVNQPKANQVAIETMIELPISSLDLVAKVRRLLGDRYLPEDLPEEPEEGPEDKPEMMSNRRNIRKLLEEEVAAMERELEKRIGGRLKAELMKWLETRLTSKREP